MEGNGEERGKENGKGREGKVREIGRQGEGKGRRRLLRPHLFLLRA